MELLRGPETDPPPIETLIFMHIGAKADDGVQALETYERKLGRGYTPLQALDETIQSAGYIRGDIKYLIDQLPEPPSN